MVSSGASAAILDRASESPHVIGDVLDRGQLVVVRQHGGAAQPRQAADFGGPPGVTLDPGVTGGRADDPVGQFLADGAELRRRAEPRLRSPRSKRVHAIQDRHGGSFHTRRFSTYNRKHATW
ncbi:hypothetical protein IWGMT90018_33580 [Mycobacterium kiyosense]|nr:hypothetical protein IWGMT90018_33580 [Mycobacterium kiyosense]